MKLSRSAGYAIAVLLQVRELAGDGPLTAAKISDGCRFPPRFLYRILRRLVNAGLLRGTSGPGGGYALAKTPQRITLLEIVQGVHSAPQPHLLIPVCDAQRAAIAQINRLCIRSSEQFAAELSRVNLAELGRGKSSRSRRGRGR